LQFQLKQFASGKSYTSGTLPKTNIKEYEYVVVLVEYNAALNEYFQYFNEY